MISLLILLIMAGIVPVRSDMNGLTMVIPDGTARIVTGLETIHQGNKILKDASIMETFQVDLRNFAAMVFILPLNFTTNHTRKMSDIRKLRLNVIDLATEGQELITEYFNLFSIETQGEVRLSAHDIVTTNKLSPILATLEFGDATLQIARLPSAGGDKKESTYISALENSQLKVKEFNSELKKILNLVNSIKENRFDIEAISQSEELWKLKDIVGIHTLGVRSDTTTILFEINILKVEETELRPNYKPVQTFGYSLNTNFFGNSYSSIAYPYICTGKYCMRDPDSQCLIDLGSRNISHILDRCNLVRTHKNLELTKLGILVYNDQNNAVNDLLEEHNVEVNVYPSLFQFNGTYIFTDKGIELKGSYKFNTNIISTIYADTDMPLIFNNNFLQLVLSQWEDLPFLITVSSVVLLNFLSFVIAIKMLKFLKKYLKCCWCSCVKRYNPVATTPVNESERIVLRPLAAAAAPIAAARAAASNNRRR